MRIIELHLKNFGKFADTRISFTDGMNLIYGENEMGKSTLFAFIKGMLFGIDRQRGKASKNDIYSIYEPWDFPGYYAGIMRFQIEDKVFRLERNFEKSQKKVILVCETDGEELSVAHGDLDILLEGLNEVNFRNTIAVGQLKCETDSGLTEEINNYLTNYEKTFDTQVDVSKATAGLWQTYKQQEKRLRELEADQKAKRQSIQTQMNYIQDEVLDKERGKAKCLKEINALRHNLSVSKNQQCTEELEKDILDKETPTKPTSPESNISSVKANNQPDYLHKTSFSVTTFGVLLVLAITIIGCSVLSAMWLKLIMGGLGCIIISVLIINLMRLYRNDKNKVSSYDSTLSDSIAKSRPSAEKFNLESNTSKDIALKDITLKDHLAKQQELQAHLSKNIWYMDKLEEEIIEKQTLLENLKVMLEEGIQISQEQEHITLKLEALALSIQTIDKLSNAIYSEKGNWLNKEASKILSEITDQKYTHIRIDDKGKVFINTPNKLLGLEKVSRGTLEQVYFSLRMASAKILYQAEQMPVILDEVFAMYDEKRLSRALQWLSESGMQVLIFTCHKREREILIKESIPFYEAVSE